MNVHFSSLKMDWQTPDAAYNELNKEFHFDYDPCPVNPDINGLLTKWGKSNFVNPPYGNELPKWIEKGYTEHIENNSTVVFLIPSRTDTRWWHDFCMKADEIRFIKGRLKFKGATNLAPFPSAIVIFRADTARNGLHPSDSKPSTGHSEAQETAILEARISELEWIRSKFGAFGYKPDFRIITKRIVELQAQLHKKQA